MIAWPDGAVVEVPATSANLGPGFDALGVALDVTLTVAAGAREDRRVTTVGEGAQDLPSGDDNLVWRAVRAWCRHAGTDVPDVSLRVRTGIPLERGLGSSAAAAVAGLVLGRGLTGGDAPDGDLIRLATELEGHPDNAAAAVLGGLVVCYDGRARRLEPSAALRPVVLVPSTRQATSAARALLPATVPLAAAAANGARTAAVLAGLTGAVALDPTAMTDVLHEPPRLQAMPDSGRLVGALREQGIAACLSGAGPSVLAVVPTAEAGALDAVRSVAGRDVTVLVPRWHRAGAHMRVPLAG